jgi:Tol biopolymer transport system component
MSRGRVLTVSLAATLVLAACSGRSDREQAQDRPAPSTAASEAPVTSLSGRIVFDNFHDVWSINADGTGLARLTRSPEPEFDPTLSPDGRFIAYRREPQDIPRSGS